MSGYPAFKLGGLSIYFWTCQVFRGNSPPNYCLIFFFGLPDISDSSRFQQSNSWCCEIFVGSDSSFCKFQRVPEQKSTYFFGGSARFPLRQHQWGHGCFEFVMWHLPGAFDCWFSYLDLWPWRWTYDAIDPGEKWLGLTLRWGLGGGFLLSDSMYYKVTFLFNLCNWSCFRFVPCVCFFCDKNSQSFFRRQSQHQKRNMRGGSLKSRGPMTPHSYILVKLCDAGATSFFGGKS